jgi:hypothetical protein
MNWQALPKEQQILFSPIGLRLIDEFTGHPPSVRVHAGLDYEDSVGNWHPVDREPVVTPGGFLTYPGLGRSADPLAERVRRYRVTLLSDYYRPEYLRTVDGIVFDVHPYNDEHPLPPAVVPDVPQTELVLPNSSYRYESQVRVVRGLVQDIAGRPVPNVEVSEGLRERVLTDERGSFALPLRWPDFNAAGVALDAVDHRTGRSDNFAINLPGDLFQSHLFTIT